MSARSIIGVATQPFWSGLSFIVSVLLARYMTLEEFGWYALALTAKQFFAMVLGALVLIPLTIFSGRTENMGSRAARNLSAVAIVRVVALAGLALGIALNFIFDFPAAQFVVFVIGGLAVELQRRVNFIDDRVHEDLIGGIVSLSFIVTAILIAHMYGYLSLSAVFMVIGGMNLLWAIVSGWKLWTRWAPIAWNELVEMWRLGRWGLASNFTGYVYSQLYVFLTLPLVGPAGVGILELGRQLVTFVQVLILGMSNVWQPRLAKSAATDPPRTFLRLVWRMTRLQTAIGAIMLLVVLLAMPSLLPVLFPGKEDVFPLTVSIAWILAVGMICQLLWQHPSFAAIALGKPEYGFVSRLTTSLLLIPVGFALTFIYGVIGAAWTRTIGEILVLALSITMLYRAVAHEERAASLASRKGAETCR